MKLIPLTIIVILSFILLGCDKEKTYSIDELTNDRELTKSVYARCTAGELSMKSETCENAEKIERMHEMKDAFGS